MKYRFLIAFIAVVVLVIVAPFYAAAITTPEIITVLIEGLTATRVLVQDAYCAAGVGAFCP